MSRREGRESDSKRHRSKFDREPSPKKSRRDGKPATERPSSNLNLDVGDHSDRDKKHRRRLQDALPLELPPPADSKAETGSRGKDSEKKTSGQHEDSKNSSNPTDVSRSRSYFQHDERGQAGRTIGRGAASERGWWRDSKDQHGERGIEKTATRDTEQKNEKSQARADEDRVWRHDGFHEIEADRQPPPARKRPSFRERKVEVEPENAAKAGAEPGKPSRPDRPLLESERKEERGGHIPRYTDGSEKTFAREREANRGAPQRGSFLSRDRYGGGGGNNYRGGRDRFNGRRGSGSRPSGARVEKWKHDLFEEANKSPAPKNEEDQIAKVEALLAS